MTNYQTFTRVQFQLLFLCSILIIIYTSYFNFEAIEKRDNKHKPQLLNPARPDGSTWWLDRSGFNKRPAVATARPNPGDPGEPGRDLVFFFFFQMWDLKPISIYTLCFHEKNHVFSMWDKNLLV